MSQRKSSTTRAKRRKIVEQDKDEHPLLIFNEPEYLVRYNSLKNRVIDPNRYIDWDEMEKAHLEEDIVAYLRFGGLYDMAQIREDCYRELFLEFLSTFNLDRNAVNLNKDKVMKFRLGRRWWKLSFDEFGVNCGFYIEDYVNEPRFQNALYEFPKDVSAERFWTSLTWNENDPCCDDVQYKMYNAQNSKASCILKPCLRVIHKWLAHSLHGRKGSFSNVTLSDLLSLYCMVHSYPLNLGRIFAIYMQHQLNSTRGGGLCGGTYITRLAKNLGVFDENQKFVILKMIPINISTLKRLNVVKQKGKSIVLSKDQMYEDDTSEEELPSAGDENEGNTQTPGSRPSLRRLLTTIHEDLQTLKKQQKELNEQIQALTKQQKHLNSRQLWMHQNLEFCFQKLKYTPSDSP